MARTILATLLAAAYACYVHGQSSCTTPSGGIGTCKSIYQCDALLDLVNKNSRTPDDINLLQKSQCGSQGTTPSLCCPETCHTPDNHPGRCGSIFTCPYLLNLLRLPVSQETMQYIQYSRCLDSNQYSVCCSQLHIMSLGPVTATPANNRSMTPFTLVPGRSSSLPLILNPENPTAEPATNRPVTTSTLPYNPPKPISSTDAPATNRPVTTSTMPPNPSTDTPSARPIEDKMVDNEITELPCLTPSGELGTCKSIRRCDALLGLVTKTNRTLQETNLLRNSHCGFSKGDTKVCCPELCFTPDGQRGRCKSIHSCPHLANIINPPASNESMKYILNSRCESSDVYSVCCGPPPNLSPPPKGNCAAMISAFPPDPRTECCGLESRVDNEQVAPGITRIDQYPWLVMIEYNATRDGKVKTLCVGALISGNYVLTAANCLIGAILNFGTPLNIRLGEFNTSNKGPDCVPVKSGGMDCTEGAIVIPIEQTIPHPSYDPLNMTEKRNDIGLIRMQRMAPFTDFIRPICLPQDDVTLTLPTNWTLYAAGWGYVSRKNRNSQLKLHVDLPFRNLEVCQADYNVTRRKIALWDKQLCAGGVFGKDTCNGDAGSPLMYQVGRTFDVIGLTSFGPKPCGQGIPGVYTKIYAYNTWIRRTIRP